MSHKWRFTGCNIDGYIGGNGARTPSHLNLHQSVHQRKRASTKNQIGVDSSVELTLAQYNNSNGGRWLYIVLVQQRTLSLVHKTHHLAPQQPTSLKPIRPTTVFTRIGFHQRCNARKWSTYGWCFLIFSEILNWTMGEVIFHFEMIIAGILKRYSNMFRL